MSRQGDEKTVPVGPCKNSILLPGPDGEDLYVPKEEWDSWPGDADMKTRMAFAEYAAVSVRKRMPGY